jgi:murein L,D-transpeptidase YafK
MVLYTARNRQRRNQADFLAFKTALVLMIEVCHRLCRLRSTLRVSLLALLVSLLPAFAAAAQPWMLVDTEALTLTVMQDEQPQLTMHNLAIGRYGATSKKYRGDNMTPLGQFRITHIKRDTPFHRFIALSYPDAERAISGRGQGDVSERELQTILAAHRRGKAPPQNTALGGRIGIHGLGTADPQLHETMNWTRGCVALTDRQIDSLLPWLRIGMTVEIR